jgi:CIC family chloride channel protein
MNTKTFDASWFGCNHERPLSRSDQKFETASLREIFSRFKALTPSRAWEATGVGILALAAAGAALLFHAFTVWIEHNTIERFEAMGPRWFIIGSLVSVVVGSLLASFLIAKFAPTTGGGGVLPVKLAFWKEFGVMTKREAVVKLLASSLTLGSGVSMGPEGPSLQIGAATMSSGAAYFGIAKQARRAWCAAGAAAGLAAVFNAPLAGITFILEEIIGDLHSRLLGRVVIAAVVGALIAHAVLGPQPAFQTSALGVIRWQAWLLVPFVAILAASGGALFQKLALRLRGKLNVPVRTVWSPYKAVIGAVITWVVGVGVYLFTGHAGVFGIGYTDITAAIAGQLVWTTALALFVGKILATAGAVGSNGCGGIFAPSLFIGAAAGAFLSGAAGFALHLATGEVAMLVMTGMAASLGAVIRAPFTCVLLIFEVTNQWVILPALILATLLSQIVARLFNHHDMYEETLLQNGVDPNQVLPPRHFKRWREIPVSALASFHPVTASAVNAAALKELLERSTHERFPIVNSAGKTIGVLSRREAELVVSGASRQPEIEPPTWIDPRSSVGEARKKLLGSSSMFLCVGDEETSTLQGIMTVHDLLRGESVLEDDGT